MARIGPGQDASDGQDETGEQIGLITSAFAHDDLFGALWAEAVGRQAAMEAVEDPVFMDARSPVPSRLARQSRSSPSLRVEEFGHDGRRIIDLMRMPAQAAPISRSQRRRFVVVRMGLVGQGVVQGGAVRVRRLERPEQVAQLFVCGSYGGHGERRHDQDPVD